MTKTAIINEYEVTYSIELLPSWPNSPLERETDIETVIVHEIRDEAGNLIEMDTEDIERQVLEQEKYDLEYGGLDL